MGFHKGVAAQDDSVAKVANFAVQLLRKRKFTLLLLHNLLGFVQFDRRRTVLGGSSALDKQVLAILSADFLTRGGLRQVKDDPDSFKGRSGPLDLCNP